MRFDGLNDYVTVPDNTLLRIRNAMTIEAWIYLEDYVRNKKKHVVDKYEYGGYNLRVSAEGNACFVLNIGGTARIVTSNTILNNNQWYHIAGSYDGSVMKVYINGQEENRLYISGEINHWSGSFPLGIGAALAQQQSTYNYFFPGIIDEVKIWDFAQMPTAVMMSRNLNKIPSNISLCQNFPNPFNPITNINYRVSKQAWVNLTIFDIKGRKVIELINELKSPGNYIIQWNGKNNFGYTLPSGSYLCRYTEGSNIQTINMLMIK